MTRICVLICFHYSPREGVVLLGEGSYFLKLKRVVPDATLTLSYVFGCSLRFWWLLFK